MPKGIARPALRLAGRALEFKPIHTCDLFLIEKLNRKYLRNKFILHQVKYSHLQENGFNKTFEVGEIMCNGMGDLEKALYFKAKVCRICNQDVHFANSCKCSSIRFNNVEYKPVKFGEEKTQDYSSYERCFDCNVIKYGYHHPGCEAEECPKCGCLLLICKCIENT